MDDNGSSNDEEDPIDEYRSSLEDLTFNSKPLINVLTMLAEENISKADGIVKVIKERIEKVNPLMKMASLYLLDSILKNVGKDYRTCIALHIVDVFKHVFTQGDEKVKVSLFKLRHTWGQFFTPKLLCELDTNIHNLDPNWPVSGQPPPSPTIHVNPKFLKQQKAENKPSTVPTQEELLQAEEKRIQEQLKKLQEAKLEIEKKKKEEKVRNLEALRKQQEEREKLLEEQKRKISALQSDEGKQSNKLENLTVTISNQPQSTDKKPADPRLAKRDSKPSPKDSSKGEHQSFSQPKSTTVIRDPKKQGRNAQNVGSAIEKHSADAEKGFEALQRSEGSTLPSRALPITKNTIGKGNSPTRDREGVKPGTKARKDDINQVNAKSEGNSNLSRDPRLLANKRSNSSQAMSRLEDNRSRVHLQDPRLARQNKAMHDAQPSGPQDKRHTNIKSIGPGDHRFERENKGCIVEDQSKRIDFQSQCWPRGSQRWRDEGMADQDAGHFDERHRIGDIEKEHLDQFRSFPRPVQDIEGPPFKRIRGRDHLSHPISEETECLDSEFLMPDEERLREEDITRGHYPKRRLSAVERRASKMRAREERKRMVPKEKELPPELRMDNHQELMHEIEVRLKSGKLTEHEHNGLVDQLELLYRIQRNRRDVSEIELKARQLKEHRERAQLQELAKSIERQSGFDRVLMEPNEEQARRMHPTHPLDMGLRDDIPIDIRRMRETLHHFQDNAGFHSPDHGRGEQFMHPPEAGPRPELPQDDWIRPWHRPDFPRLPPDRRFLDAPPMRHEFPPMNRWPDNRPNFPDQPIPDLSADIARWSRSLDEHLPPEFIHRREQLVPGGPPPVARMDWDMHVSHSGPMPVRHSEMEDERNRLLPVPGPLPSAHPGPLDALHSRWREPPEIFHHAVNNSGQEQSNEVGVSAAEYAQEQNPFERPLPPSSQDSGLPSSTMSSAESDIRDDVAMETSSFEVSQTLPLQETLQVSQPIIPSTEETISTSSAPAFMGVADLFKKLVTSGIISLHKEAEIPRVETPPPELPTEEEAIPEIKISLDSLRLRHTSIINRLYKGVQCASCGLRFLEDDKDAYAEHLDWHFRQNKRQKDVVKASSRTWYSPAEIWTSSDGVMELKEEAAPQSVFEVDAVKFEKDDQEDYTCAVEPVEDDDICDVCCELFEQFWDEDLEEWRYRGAVRVNGRTYHYSCFKDSGAVALEIDNEDEEEMTVDSTEPLETSSSQPTTPPPSVEIIAEDPLKVEPANMEAAEPDTSSFSQDIVVKEESKEYGTTTEDCQLMEVKVEEQILSPADKNDEISKTPVTDVVIGDKIVNVVKSETIKDENIKKEDITG